VKKEELHDFCSPSSSIRMIKSRIIRWAEHVAHVAESRGAYRVLVLKPEGRTPFRMPRRRGILNKSAGRRGLDLAGSGFGQVAGCCGEGNEPSGSTRCAEFF
jgi:hypothetical protein